MAHIPSLVLVTDFDGTITAEDFYTLVVDRLLQPGDLAPWNDYRAGRITHFTALQRIFARIRAPEEAVRELLGDMRPDPHLRESAAALEAAHWKVVVASAGCEWYIRHILDPLKVNFEVHANPGTYAKGGPLRMEPPLDSPFYSPETGIDKAGIVRFHLERGATVAYAGDGFTDLGAALLVPPDKRFARADLAVGLDRKEEPYRPFSFWSQVAAALLSPGEAP